MDTRTPCNATCHNSGCDDGHATRRRVLLGGTALSLSLAAPAVRALPTPRVKPPNPQAASRILQGAEFRAFQEALGEGRDGDWRAHARLAAQVSDPTAQNVLAWQRARRDTQVPWTTLSHVARNLEGWPGMVGIRAKAEDELLESRRPAAEVVAWFGNREPVSGEGRIALARAHYALGNAQRGEAYLHSGWRDARLDRDLQREVFAEFGDRLTSDDHAARVDHLIWVGKSQHSKAQALLPYLEAGPRALHTARMALRERRGNVNALIDAVPPALVDSPELNFDRAQWRRAKLEREDALPAFLAMDGPVADTDGRDDVWRAKKSMVYWLVGERNYADAYALTLRHGLESGAAFQEAEFLAGWLSLRYLGEPQRAERHFFDLYQGVSRPISRARGAYWLGRTKRAQGQEAEPFLRIAASFPNTYYGQIAARELGEATLQLPTDPEAALVTDSRGQAMRLLGEAGERRLMEQFSFALDDDVESLPELAGVAELALRQGSRRASVRAAKQAARLNTMLVETGYPLPVSVTSLDPNRFDVPFTLAIARQESEFATDAVSSARAYGMMQMIDSTARATARKHGIRYSRQQMLSDEFYAARMGSLHLNDLLARFDGSYPLVCVAYNAGPTRARQWIERFGDPRLPSVDTIDWIESIPISETRNYVQRVMENMQVYRARLQGGRAPNRIVEAVGI